MTCECVLWQLPKRCRQQQQQKQQHTLNGYLMEEDLPSKVLMIPRFRDIEDDRKHFTTLLFTSSTRLDASFSEEFSRYFKNDSIWSRKDSWLLFFVLGVLEDLHIHSQQASAWGMGWITQKGEKPGTAFLEAIILLCIYRGRGCMTPQHTTLLYFFVRK